MANISQFHGEVKKCNCGIADHPANFKERACPECRNRGFLATCLGCEGTGSFTAKMAGGPGTMSSTCSLCGGQGHFGVNRPDDWVDAPVEAVEEVPAVA